MGPAPELKVTASAGQVERGKYLANHVAVCMDCHSQRDFSQFAGPVKPGTLGSGGELGLGGNGVKTDYLVFYGWQRFEVGED